MDVADDRALVRQEGQLEHMADTSLAHDELHVDSAALDVTQIEVVVLAVDHPAVLDSADSAFAVAVASLIDLAVVGVAAAQRIVYLAALAYYATESA